MAIKSVYVLQIAVDNPIVFYVGCTNDINRRAREHELNSHNPEHPEYYTYKYQTIRDIEAAGLTWEMQVEVLSAEIDEDSEYWWVLTKARENQAKNIKFIDDLPLTNMKAGDFLHEMLQDKSVYTKQDVKAFLAKRRQEKAVEYTRDQITNPVSRSILDRVKAEWAPIKQAKQEKQNDREQRRKKQEAAVAEARERQRAEWERNNNNRGA